MDTKFTPKKEIETQIQIEADRIARMFGIADDQEVFISVSGSGVAEFTPAKNMIQISLSRLSIETIAHELAHWVQHVQDGATYCWESCRKHPGFNAAAANKHVKLTSTIQQELKMNFGKVWTNLMG
jgi:hypothetical protein